MNDQQRQQHEPDETMQVESEEQEQGKREIEVREENLPSRAAAVHEQIRMEGEKELERDGLALLWSAIAAGLSMGASLAAKGIFHARLPDDPSRFFIENLGYTFGFRHRGIDAHRPHGRRHVNINDAEAVALLIILRRETKAPCPAKQQAGRRRQPQPGGKAAADVIQPFRPRQLM